MLPTDESILKPRIELLLRDIERARSDSVGDGYPGV